MFSTFYGVPFPGCLKEKIVKRRYLTIPVMVLIAFGLTAAGWSETPIPKKKQTALGLYTTAEKAFLMWQLNPEETFILDVRTPEEYFFIGHAPMARHIPVRFLDQHATMVKARPVMTWNSSFVSKVKTYYKTTDKVLIMCRSGGRSAAAVNLLTEAGFTHVYNIIDGFEGDVLKDAQSRDNGKRVKNGWRNTQAPWTYAINPGLVYRP